jgi:hypothetical protein
MPTKDLRLVGVSHGRPLRNNLSGFFKAPLQVRRNKALVDAFEKTSPVVGHGRQLAMLIAPDGETPLVSRTFGPS